MGMTRFTDFIVSHPETAIDKMTRSRNALFNIATLSSVKIPLK
jgi:hypothetical protein